MKQLVIDFRCPRCNQPVIGKEDVGIRRKMPVAMDKCPKCKASIKLVKSGRREVIDYHWE